MTGEEDAAMFERMARKKPHAGKIGARMPKRLTSAFRSWIEGAADDYKYFGRRMGVEPCVGALVNHFMNGLDDAGRRALIAEWLPDLEVRESVEAAIFVEAGLITAGQGDPVEEAAAVMARFEKLIERHRIKREAEARESLSRELREMEEIASMNLLKRSTAKALSSVDPVSAPEDAPAPAYNPVIASTARKRALPEAKPKRPKRSK